MTETNGCANQDADATNGVVAAPPANQGQQATANAQGGDAGPPPSPQPGPERQRRSRNPGPTRC